MACLGAEGVRGLVRALVTGAAGFIGSHLVDRLLAEGHEVVGIDSFEDYYPRTQKEANIARARENGAFRLIEANIIDLATDDGAARLGASLGDLIEASDWVFHLAAQAGVRASWGESFRIYTDNNVLATQMLLEACKGTGIKRFVYASSSSVYGDTTELPMREDAVCRPHSPYGVTKLAAEHLCHLYFRNFDVPCVSLRYFTVYGPRQRPDMAIHRFMRAARDGRPLTVYGDGTQTREFTFVSDVVDATVRAAMCDASEALGRPYNVGGGTAISVSGLLDAIRDVVGRELELRREPAQPGDVSHTGADMRRAREALGFEAVVGLEEGLRAEWEWAGAWGRAARVGPYSAVMPGLPERGAPPPVDA